MKNEITYDTLESVFGKPVRFRPSTSDGAQPVWEIAGSKGLEAVRKLVGAVKQSRVQPTPAQSAAYVSELRSERSKRLKRERDARYRAKKKKLKAKRRKR